VQTAIGLLHRYAGHGETTAALRQALELAAAPDAPRACVGKLGEGWVGEEALAIALYACLAATDFKDAIRIAANHDGDSDSTASIAGQLYGAWRGEDSLAREWLEPLDVLEPVEELLTQALAHSAH
jgi:ADP-ribosylglycohydrolase